MSPDDTLKLQIYFVNQKSIKQMECQNGKKLK